MFQEIAAAVAQGEVVALLTVVRTHGAAPCAPGTKAMLRDDGSLVGGLGSASAELRAHADARKLLEEGGPADIFVYHLDPESGESVGSCGATLEVFIEPVRPEPRLVIAGSGYVALALARLTTPLGWHVAMVDDRSENTRSARLPDSVEVEVGEIADFIRAQRPNQMTAVVIVTRGHRSDREALAAALETEAGYVGMIGSPSKTRAIFKALLRGGMATEALARAHAPIGLDIHAHTPDEIALSIAAELLMWRRGGTGLPLYASNGILEKLLAGVASDAPEDESDETDAVEVAG